jgi:hypothetical protein
MKAPDYDGEDYFWVTDNLGPVSAQVFGSVDPEACLASLVDWQRKLFHVGSAVHSIMNGGVDGYLSGPNGDEVDELEEVLVEIGAEEMLGTVAQMRRFFPESKVPKDYQDRIDCIDGICTGFRSRRLDDLFEIRIDDHIWALIRKLDPLRGNS